MSDKTEVDRAAYYEARKDDDREWGDAEPSKPRRRLASMFSVRLSPREAVIVREAAEVRSMTISAFLRAAALKEAMGPEKIMTPLRSLQSNSTQAFPLQVTMQSVPPNADIRKIGETSLAQTIS